MTEWSVEQDAEQKGSAKPKRVRVALLKDHPDRFVLWKDTAFNTKGMWILYDDTVGTFSLLSAPDWKQAQAEAAQRIHEILYGSWMT